MPLVSIIDLQDNNIIFNNGFTTDYSPFAENKRWVTFLLTTRRQICNLFERRLSWQSHFCPRKNREYIKFLKHPHNLINLCGRVTSCVSMISTFKTSRWFRPVTARLLCVYLPVGMSITLFVYRSPEDASCNWKNSCNHNYKVINYFGNYDST